MPPKKAATKDEEAPQLLLAVCLNYADADMDGGSYFRLIGGRHAGVFEDRESACKTVEKSQLAKVLQREGGDVVYSAAKLKGREDDPRRNPTTSVKLGDLVSKESCNSVVLIARRGKNKMYVVLGTGKTYGETEALLDVMCPSLALYDPEENTIRNVTMRQVSETRSQILVSIACMKKARYKC